jgi:hypothetical protein
MPASFIPLERSSSTSSSHLSLSGSLTQSSGTSTSTSCPPSPGQHKLDYHGSTYISVEERRPGCEAISSFPSNQLEIAQSSAWLSPDPFEVLQRDDATAAVSLAKCRSLSGCNTRSDSAPFVIPQGALSLKSNELQFEYDKTGPEARMAPPDTICDMHPMKPEVPFPGRAVTQETNGRTSRYIEVS